MTTGFETMGRGIETWEKPRSPDRAKTSKQTLVLVKGPSHIIRNSLSQQQFLLSAMDDLGMTQAAFSARIGCAKRTLTQWLESPTSKEYREINESVWCLVREILKKS